MNHDGPGHARDLVGERHRRHLYRSAHHDPCEPRPFRAVLACIANDRHRTGDQQPSQVAIALLGDAAKPLLAAGRMLLGHQSDPGGKVAPERNCGQSPISATSAVATIGPMPGISSSRRLSSHERCQAWMRLSMAPISAVMATY